MAMTQMGKNPVSSLMEWGQQNTTHKIEFYANLKTFGQSHDMRFLCLWEVDEEYMPGVFAKNKKEGKAQSASLALKCLMQPSYCDSDDLTEVVISESFTVKVLTASIDEVVSGHISADIRSANNAIQPQQSAMSTSTSFNPAFSQLLSSSSQSMSPAPSSLSSSPDAMLDSAISQLHERGQRSGIVPRFQITNTDGPPHNRSHSSPGRFTGRCTYGDVVCEASGANKSSCKKKAFALVLDKVILAERISSDSPEAAVSRVESGMSLEQTSPSAAAAAADSDGRNAVSELMEMLNKLSIVPDFKCDPLSDTPGPRRFQCSLTLSDSVDDDDDLGEVQFNPGFGANKKEAKLDCARIALDQLKSKGILNARLTSSRHLINSRELDLISNPMVGAKYDQQDVQNILNHRNPISMLNELAQKERAPIRWEVVDTVGPSHCPRFTVRCVYNNRDCPCAEARTKAEAKKQAAELALRFIHGQGEETTAQVSQPDEVAAEEESDWDADRPRLSLLLPYSTYSSTVHSIHQHSMSSSASAMPLPLAESAADIIANKVLQKFDRFRRNLSTGKVILAGVVLEIRESSQNQDSQYMCVSIGTGNTVIGGDRLSDCGDVVHDSHAEIVARRGLLRFLYSNLSMYPVGSQQSIYQQSTSSSKFKLKDDHHLHLYISTAPCGDGALFTHNTNDSPGAVEASKRPMKSSEHRPCDAKRGGCLRCKIEDGQGTVYTSNIPTQTLDGIRSGSSKLHTMSCSDKICKWNVLGLQGTLLSQIMEPVYLQSLVLGQLYHNGHLSRALCCRVSFLNDELLSRSGGSYRVNHPDLALAGEEPSRRDTSTKTTELSVNWSYGDLDCELVSGPMGVVISTGISSRTASRICRQRLYDLWKEWCSQTMNEHLIKASYLESKAMATEYTKNKELLYQKFEEKNLSKWLRKPEELALFN